MSRIGRVPVQIPQGVTVTVKDNTVLVKGTKGELAIEIIDGISVEVVDNKVKVSRKDDSFKAFHGLMSRLIANMIVGVSQGYKKSLEIVGVGFKSAVEGKILVINVSYSHPIRYEIPKGIQVEIEKNVIIHITGIDKQLVGHVAATIKKFCPPEPYKGKGIRYLGEQIKRKAGKTVA